LHHPAASEAANLLRPSDFPYLSPRQFRGSYPVL
jgi:hypothetical protein